VPVAFPSFNRGLEYFSKVFVPSQSRVFQIKLAFELLTRIVFRTPVDTGRARGNWQIGIGEAPTGLTEDDEDGSQTNAEGLRRLGEYTSGVVTIWIVNNVNYISFLEDGSSQRQAPAGMVALSLAEVETIFTQLNAA